MLGDKGLQEFTYKTIEDKKNVSFKATNAWLGITDKYWAATLIPDTKAPIAGAVLRPARLGTQKTYQTDYLGDGADHRAGRDRRRPTPRLFAGAKEVAVIDGYEKQLGLNRFDLLIDWGWFYFITKPMFWSIDWIYQHVGNFGIAILLITVLIKVDLLPARQQVLRLDGEDEGGAAGDGGDPRALRRRQGEAAAGADGALQEGEDQSAGRLPADPDPDAGVLRALQGAVHHHRDAARAVLRLDQGPVRARSDQPLQPVRADPLRPDADPGVRPVPASRLLADHHGHHDVGRR